MSAYIALKTGDKFGQIFKKMSFAEILLISLICAAAVSSAHKNAKSNLLNKFRSEKIDGEFSEEWEIWKKLYKKEYKSTEEEATKYSNWLTNLNYVNKHNLKASLNMHSFTTGLNEYADLSIQDVRNTMNGYKMNKEDKMRLKANRTVFTKPENFVSWWLHRMKNFERALNFWIMVVP